MMLQNIIRFHLEIFSPYLHCSIHTIPLRVPWIHRVASYLLSFELDVPFGYKVHPLVYMVLSSLHYNSPYVILSSWPWGLSLHWLPVYLSIEGFIIYRWLYLPLELKTLLNTAFIFCFWPCIWNAEHTAWYKVGFQTSVHSWTNHSLALTFFLSLSF